MKTFYASTQVFYEREGTVRALLSTPLGGNK